MRAPWCCSSRRAWDWPMLRLTSNSRHGAAWPTSPRLLEGTLRIPISVGTTLYCCFAASTLLALSWLTLLASQAALLTHWFSLRYTPSPWGLGVLSPTCPPWVLISLMSGTRVTARRRRASSIGSTGALTSLLFSLIPWWLTSVRVASPDSAGRSGGSLWATWFPASWWCWELPYLSLARRNTLLTHPRDQCSPLRGEFSGKLLSPAEMWRWPLGRPVRRFPTQAWLWAKSWALLHPFTCWTVPALASVAASVPSRWKELNWWPA